MTVSWPNCMWEFLTVVRDAFVTHRMCGVRAGIVTYYYMEFFFSSSRRIFVWGSHSNVEFAWLICMLSSWQYLYVKFVRRVCMKSPHVKFVLIPWTCRWDSSRASFLCWVRDSICMLSLYVEFVCSIRACTFSLSAGMNDSSHYSFVCWVRDSICM